LTPDKQQRIEEAIRPFLPTGVSVDMAALIVKHRCHLTITRDRSSKLGDYRHPTKTSGHKVSVNGSLNRFAFLITFIHEMAHLTAWEKYKRNADPHGEEWKNEFKLLMQPYLRPDVFPEPLLSVLARHMRNPKSSTVRDAALMREIRAYDPPRETILLEQLPTKAIFQIGSREFIKGDLLRKRYRCTERSTGRNYLVSPIAEVILVLEEELDED
jgi:SprT protein